MAAITHPTAVSIWRIGFLLLFDYPVGPHIAALRGESPALSSASIFRQRSIVFFACAAEMTPSDRAGLYFAYGDTNDNVNGLVTKTAATAYRLPVANLERCREVAKHRSS
jgi:hypothetical protein